MERTGVATCILVDLGLVALFVDEMVIMDVDLLELSCTYFSF